MKNRQLSQRFLKFLQERNITIYDLLEFQPRSNWKKNPTLSINYLDFLDENFYLNKKIINLAKQIISDHNLHFIFVVPSYWGRGDRATNTGKGVFRFFQLLKKKYSNVHYFLSYQRCRKQPSGLYRWCKRNRIPVLDVDKYELTYGKKVILPKNAPGKTENILKATVLIRQEWLKKILPTDTPMKNIAFIFVDDDYNHTNILNYEMFLIVFALSHLTSENLPPVNGEKIKNTIDKLINPIFIKSGSPRLSIPTEIREEVIMGMQKPRNYLDLCLRIVMHSLTLNRLLDYPMEQITKLITELEKLKKTKQIFTPATASLLLEKDSFDILAKFILAYAKHGGRATWRLRHVYDHNPSTPPFAWMGIFTHLLHGDQLIRGDVMEKLPLTSGYALEIGLLLVIMCDQRFADGQIINLELPPHSHEEQKNLDINRMEDQIALAEKLLLTLYRLITPHNFLGNLKNNNLIKKVDDFGRIINYHPYYRNLTIYPPPNKLHH